MLPGIPLRPDKTTRLRLELQYVSSAECKVTVTWFRNKIIESFPDQHLSGSAYGVGCQCNDRYFPFTEPR